MINYFEGNSQLMNYDMKKESIFISFFILVLQVGTHLMSATLRQLGFKIELVYANLDWQLAEVQLLKGVHVSFAYSFFYKLLFRRLI